MSLAIRVDKLSKLYPIGESRSGYSTLRDALTRKLRAPFKLRSRNGRADDDSIWALKDVSFEVKQGEIVGIVGRNGAGKSTLLKVLSRITKPTTGWGEIHGRVGSLLEVGTGFHPELTGRENIFLNGAILGMKKAEVVRNFHGIVAFAEVEKFIDTPVKHYSSGTYMRLAFAVAAYLEPEILLIDEVLAVGDASFQRKCLDKMEDVGRRGRTVLFVSHNMPAITRLCPRTVLLDSGRVSFDGSSQEAVGVYLGFGQGASARREWHDLREAPGNEIVRLRSIQVCTQEGVVTQVVDIRRPVGIEIEFEVLVAGHVLVPNFQVYNEEGQCVFVASEQETPWQRRPRDCGRYVSTAWIPGNFLSEGGLIISVAISTLDPVVVHLFERDAIAFQVVDSLDGNSARGDYGGYIPGAVRPLLQWTSLFTPSTQPAMISTRKDLS